MNRELVAKELLAVAKELTAASEIDLFALYAPAWKEAGKQFKAILKKAAGSGVKMKDEWERARSDYSYTITLTGYTAKSDLEVEVEAYFYILTAGSNSGTKVIIRASRPDWGPGSTELLNRSAGMLINGREIENAVKTAFGLR